VVVCLVAAAGFLFVAGSQLDYINGQRRQMQLVSNEPLENAPPSLAFATVAMGAFRGLVVDILWMRADRLKEQKQFFDAKQLAEWITVLQPRFASVWTFHAWNMAYNISVCIPASQPAERWRWVKNGYELLRDRAIPLNPKSPGLYQEMARIFHHKIGSVSDDAHKYYKLQLAAAMEPLLDSAAGDYFDALAAAPEEFEQAAADPGIADIIAALREADDKFDDTHAFAGNYLLLRRNPAAFKPAAIEAVDAFRGTQALKELDVFAKARQLRNAWKLEPELMRRLNGIYGPSAEKDPDSHLPLDWRHPATHSLYWAVRGLQAAGDQQYSIEQTNTDRMVGHSLQELFYNGRIFIYSVPPDKAAEEEVPLGGRDIFLRPDLRMFEPCNEARLATLEKYKTLDAGSYESLQNGHRNLLKNAVLLFYQAGLEKKAGRIYDRMRELYPLDEFKVPLVAFVRNKIREELKTIGVNDAKQIVIMLLREGYFRYALRDDDEASGREKMAREVYDDYQGRYSDRDRIDLPDFRLLRYFALMDFLNDWQFPLSLRRSLLARIRLERPELAGQLQRQEKELMEKAVDSSQ
jgi:hypothetical protein